MRRIGDYRAGYAQCNDQAPCAFAPYTLLNISGAFWMLGRIRPSWRTPAAWTIVSPAPNLRCGTANDVGTVMFLILTPSSRTWSDSCTPVRCMSFIVARVFASNFPLSLVMSSATSSSRSWISSRSSIAMSAPARLFEAAVVVVATISCCILSRVAMVGCTSSCGMSANCLCAAAMTSPNDTACSVRNPGLQKAWIVSNMTAPSEPSAFTIKCGH
mmetsp:Transcript_33198/g.50157  ORF Transcript_33198/g.50157 Transcript_33198/m.50157 type:complete len:215 (+) Transcript_33198:313-957(+)